MLGRKSGDFATHFVCFPFLGDHSPPFNAVRACRIFTHIFCRVFIVV